MLLLPVVAESGDDHNVTQSACVIVGRAFAGQLPSQASTFTTFVS